MNMPEEVFIRNGSDDNDDIDLEFTSDSDSRYQRYVRSDIAAARITAERERVNALESGVLKAQSEAIRAAFDGISSAARDSGDKWICVDHISLIGGRIADEIAAGGGHE